MNDPGTGKINASRLANGSITNSQLSETTITGDRLVNLTITSAQIANGTITTAKLVPSTSQALVPPGTILPYGGVAAPAGYLLCDGTAYPRTGTYSTLFAAISTAYGSPDASNFNVPDLRGQFLRGYIPNLMATGSSATGGDITTTAPHSFNRTGMRVRISGPTTGSLDNIPVYYVIRVNANTLALAATADDAVTGTKLAISGSVAGMVITQAEAPEGGRTFAAVGGSGSGLGSIQGDAFQNHRHEYVKGTAAGSSAATSVMGTNYGGDTLPFSSGAIGVPSVADGMFGYPRIATETRPTNVFVNYIIKY